MSPQDSSVQAPPSQAPSTQDLIHPRLTALGWSSDFAADLNPDHTPARVSARHRSALELLSADGPLRTPLPDPERLAPHPVDPSPHVGDWVLLEPGPMGPQVVARLPRRSLLLRKAAGRQPRPQVIAANLDVVFLVTSMNADFSPRRLERYLVAARGAGVEPVIVLSKADLAYDRAHRFRREAEEVAGGADVLVTSALLDDGLDALGDHLAVGRTVGFVGSSGVGKSSLINALLGEDRMKVKGVRSTDETGQHTTTHRELLELPGGRGVLLDTPGMREFQPWSAEGLDEVFGDIDDVAAGCRYRDCGHDEEPGCAVQAAIEAGELDEGRVKSWEKLQREAERLERSKPAWEQRQDRRRWGAMVREAQSIKKRW